MPLQPITTELAYRQLEGHPTWVVEPNRLYRDFRFPSFRQAIAFVNRIAELAEKLGHHPNIHVHEWCFVRLDLYSHLHNAITQGDVDMAVAIDAMLEEERR